MSFKLLRPTATRTRLWQGGVALALFVLTLAIGNNLVPADKAVNTRMLGMDFLPFYAGGTFARTGRYDLLFNLPAIKAFEQETAKANGIDLGDHVGPFWNPPFYAWVFAPLSALPYREALAIWTLFNVACLCGAVLLMIRMLPAGCSWRAWALVPLLVLVSMPFIQAISHGQNTFGSLLLLCGTVTAWRGRRAVMAGVLCGLLFYKPQLAAVLAAMLTLSLGRRTLIGLGATLAALAAVTLVTMPGATSDWLHRLPVILHTLQVENTYAWERHATLKAFWRMLLQGRGPGEARPAVVALTSITVSAAAVGLLSIVLRHRQSRTDNCWTSETAMLRRDRLIGATIAATPLLMPFYFDYDLLLLSVPAVLFAGEMLALAPGQPRVGADRWLVRLWVMLFAVLMVNSPLARVLGVGAMVPPLAGIAMLLIFRGRRQPPADPTPARVAEELGVMLRQVRRAA